ncbi:MAG: cyclopropane-fatty-acyl-phospholipid synthase family protein [Pseudomonadota bacterium]
MALDGERTLVLQRGVPVARRQLPLALWPVVGLAKTLAEGSLSITLPGGRKLRVQGAAEGPDASATLHRWGAVPRAAARGDVGLGETYAAGDWDTPDLEALLTLFAQNSRASGTAFDAGPLIRAAFGAGEWLRQNTRRQAKRNIIAHYDLGNDFYSLWLDPTMTYSSALFEGADTLEAAQEAKMAALAHDVGLSPGDHVLEIGCGWGGFARHAAAAGCTVTGLTLSPAQAAFARERAAAAGFSARITVREKDYRDEAGTYDAVVSIEMFEAVGEAYWGTYFDTLARVLKPGGRAGLQVITVDDAFFPTYRRGSDFIRTHIFPGGLLPPAGALRALGAERGLKVVAERAFGGDYARTLRLWRRHFLEAEAAVAALGHDRKFRRAWRFYLDYCAAGFATGLIDVRQITFQKAAT